MLRQRLLQVDSTGGLVVGILVLALSARLSELYRLPHWSLVVMGLANVAYGTYSGLLARRTNRPLGMLVVLVIANALWGVGCLVVAARVADTASPFALAHLAGEGLYVGALAILEWRWRDSLRHA